MIKPYELQISLMIWLTCIAFDKVGASEDLLYLLGFGHPDKNALYSYVNLLLLKLMDISINYKGLITSFHLAFLYEFCTFYL